MKKILYFLALIGLIYSCADTKKIPGEYPGEWMYMQRAYPAPILDMKAVNKVWKDYKIFSQNRSPSIGNWEQEGPLNTSGRITDLCFSPVNDDHLFIGTSTGGLFRSYDQGVTWEAIFDGWGRPSIGSLAIAESDVNRIYLGTGEANGGFDSGSYYGDGVYRSNDGGDTWENIGLHDSQHIGRIIVDPVDKDRVFAAATGVLYGTSPTRGVYRTENGGESWEQVLFVSDSTACIDVVMDPQNSDRIFAAMWERTRYPWIRDYGGVTSGVWRSEDGGDSWELLGNGLPISDTETGRIGLCMSPSEPGVVCASYTSNSITNEFSALYRSGDSGDSWTEISNGQLQGINSTFGWYFGNLRLNPHIPGQVWVLGQGLSRMNVDNESFESVGGMHVDHHAMDFSAQDPDLILAGNDGGVYLSFTNGDSWEHIENLPLTQCYRIEVDFTQPERLYAGTQDNNTIRTLTGAVNDYSSILGGDGFHVNVDYSDNSFVYAEYQWGNLFRSSDGGFSMDNALSGVDPNDRTNWNTPVLLSPADPAVLYYGSDHLYRSTDRALNWNAISPDLTDGLHPSGSAAYGTITSIGASYQDQMTIYVGTDDGNVQRSLNGGDTWTQVDADLPDRYVTGFAVHPENASICYVTFSGYKLLDFAPHIFKTTDAGLNWTGISGNLPDFPVNDIIMDITEERLFIATDMGVWYSEDDGGNWDILGNDLPGIIVNQLKLHAPSKMLYAGTYGRSIYSYDLLQLDDIGLSEAIASPRFNLFPNPSSGPITVRAEGAFSYRISSMNGKQIREGSLNKGDQSHPIDLSSLARASYLIQVQDENGWTVRKLKLE